MIRLATFPNLKDEAISFAQKVVKPLLQLLDENGPVAVCISLTFMKANFSDINFSDKKHNGICFCRRKQLIYWVYLLNSSPHLYIGTSIMYEFSFCSTFLW